MSNLNTVSDGLYQFNNSQPSTVVLNTSGNALFSAGADPISVVLPSHVTLVYGPAFKSRPLAGAPFRIKAAGAFSLNAGVNAAITLNLITPPPSSLAMASVGLASVPSGSNPTAWWLDCMFIWDGSKFVSGLYSGFFGLEGGLASVKNNFGPSFSLSGPTVASAPLTFQVQASVASGNPVNNQFTLTEFSADLI